MRSGGRRRPASPHPRASGPGVRVGRGAKPGAGCSLEPPSPTQLPPEHSVSGSQGAPGLGLKRSHFFYLVRAPCGLHAGLCCLRCWAGSTHPLEEGTSFEKVPSWGRSAGRTGCLCPQDGAGGHRVAVCDRRHSVRLPMGAVQMPPLSRGAEGPPGPWDGKRGGDHSQSCTTCPPHTLQTGWTPTHPAQSPQDASSARSPARGP